jgi:hypothetical protein
VFHPSPPRLRWESGVLPIDVVVLVHGQGIAPSTSKLPEKPFA